MAKTYSRLCVHIVFATKHRTPWILPELAAELYPLVASMVGDQGGRLLAIGGMPDHVHLLVDQRPNLSVAALVKVIKGTSSRWINETRRTPDRFAWQEGYSAFSVSPSVLPKVRSYIQTQEQHHRKSTFESEQRTLLAKHGIALDEAELEG